MTRYCPGCDLVTQAREQIPEQAKGVHVGLVYNDGQELDE